MSYDITTQLFARRAAADAALTQNQTPAEAQADAARAEFLQRLDAAGFEVTDWEARFIESFLSAAGAALRPYPNWWTSARRLSCDHMLDSYEYRLPGFCTHVAAPPPGARSDLPKHVPGECGYLVRGEDRRLERCGKPVAYKTPQGLEICADHKAARDEWRKRNQERNQRR